jgi:hypothetical protein
MLMGGLRALLFQGSVFLLGVFIGRCNLPEADRKQ